MSINELSNEELLYCYFSNKEKLDQYKAIFEVGGIEDIVDILEIGRITIFNKYDQEALEELLDDPHYIGVTSINDKLEPIADMIGDTDPELFNRIQEAFLNSVI